MPLTDLVSFVRVMDAGSVSAASRELGIPRPTLSRRVSRLEEHYGVRLVHRTTRSLTLTDAGQEVYQQGRAIVSDLDALDERVRYSDGAITGHVRVSIGVAGSSPFYEMCAAFLREHPGVQLEVNVTSRRVDLVAERIDVVIRGGQVGNDELMGNRLRTTRSGLVASAAYLESHGTPQSLEDLNNHALLAGFAGGTQPARTWPLLGGGTVSITPRVAVNELGGQLQLVGADLGIALVPEDAVGHQIESGQVRRVLEDVVGQDGGLYILYADRAYVPPQVRAFIEHTKRWIATMPAWPLQRPCP